MMRISVCLLSNLLHVAAGCILSQKSAFTVTGHTGQPVLFPCTCTQITEAPRSIRWLAKKENNNDFANICYSPGDKSCTDINIKMFNQDSPGNLSILLLTVDADSKGVYRCEVGTNTDQYVDITLSVKGIDTKKEKFKETLSVEPTSYDNVSHQLPWTGATATYIGIAIALAAATAVSGACLAVLLYRRRNGKKPGSPEGGEGIVEVVSPGENRPSSSVTYTTVIHPNQVRKVDGGVDTWAPTEYATISHGTPS